MKTHSLTILKLAACSMALALLIPACREGGPSHSHTHSHAHDHGGAGHHHFHEPLHGGTAVVLGNEDFHIEFVRDAEEGRMQAYIMDAHMESYVRVPLESFEVEARLPEGPQTLTFKAVAKSATGETVGNTALFEAEADWLKTHGDFDAVLKGISIRGKQYEAVSFHFPAGNPEAGSAQH
jgi:hypothetical protein